MIEELHIENLGVIESAHVELGPGLTVLTGETGAGKTMVLTSLQLLLGQRADLGKVRAGADEAVVDGVFRLAPDAPVEYDLEDDCLIVTRKVSASRSRAYLDRRPAPVSALSDLAPHLAVVHSQSDQLQLRSPAKQRELLDRFAGNNHLQILNDYTDAWARAVRAKQELDIFARSLAEVESEIASLRPVLKKIHALDPQEGEEESLRIEAERITNAEQLRQGLQGAYNILTSEEGSGALDAVGVAASHIQRVESYDPQLGALAQRLLEQLVELESVTDDISHYLSGLNADPARLEYVHQRRRDINALLRGRALDIPALLQWAQEAQTRLEDLENRDDKIAELQDQLKEAQQAVLACGRQLTLSRRKAAEKLSRLVDAELAGLSMKDAHFIVSLPSRPKPGPNGLEDVDMLLQAHRDANPVPLGQGASGGELSRILLALEVSLAEHAEGPNPHLTYVFDEVDAGVGGRAAREVGHRLARLAKDRQVLVVTHLAQVAAWADSHVVIAKKGATTSVRELSEDERIVELARMLSGSESSQTARAHAAELRLEVKVAQSKA